MRSQLLCAVALLGGAGVAHAQALPGYAPGPGGGGYPAPGGPPVAPRYYQGYAQPFPFFPTAAAPDQAARAPAVYPPPGTPVALPAGPVTTGGVMDVHPGALGQPNTGVLFGDSLDFRMFSGVRWDIGIYLDEDAHWSLDGGGLFLFTNHTDFAAVSDANGNPVIARPIFNV